MKLSVNTSSYINSWKLINVYHFCNTMYAFFLFLCVPSARLYGPAFLDHWEYFFWIILLYLQEYACRASMESLRDAYDYKPLLRSKGLLLQLAIDCDNAVHNRLFNYGCWWRSCGQPYYPFLNSLRVWNSLHLFGHILCFRFYLQNNKVVPLQNVPFITMWRIFHHLLQQRFVFMSLTISSLLIVFCCSHLFLSPRCP